MNDQFKKLVIWYKACHKGIQDRYDKRVNHADHIDFDYNNSVKAGELREIAYNDYYIAKQEVNLLFQEQKEILFA